MYKNIPIHLQYTLHSFPSCYVHISAEAVPKKILELMNVPGLTRENVASHLQVENCHNLLD